MILSFRELIFSKIFFIKYNKMPHQLAVDCLIEIFGYLDEFTLHSCLLVNRLWCKVSVRILWKSIQNYNNLIAVFLMNQKKFYARMKSLFLLQLQRLYY